MLLVIDSATAACSAALLDGEDGVIDERHELAGLLVRHPPQPAVQEERRGHVEADLGGVPDALRDDETLPLGQPVGGHTLLEPGDDHQVPHHQGCDGVLAVRGRERQLPEETAVGERHTHHVLVRLCHHLADAGGVDDHRRGVAGAVAGELPEGLAGGEVEGRQHAVVVASQRGDHLAVHHQGRRRRAECRGGPLEAVGQVVPPEELAARRIEGTAEECDSSALIAGWVDRVDLDIGSQALERRLRPQCRGRHDEEGATKDQGLIHASSYAPYKRMSCGRWARKTRRRALRQGAVAGPISTVESCIQPLSSFLYQRITMPVLRSSGVSCTWIPSPRRSVTVSTVSRGALIGFIAGMMVIFYVRGLARGGRLVTCGATTGPQAAVDLRFLFGRQLSLLGSYMGRRGELLDARPFFLSGRLRPAIDRVHPLREAVAAQERLEAAGQFGKIVLEIE
mgnify:CR=1 FL=1